MIAFLRGILVDIQEEAVIVDVNGIGYLVRVPASTVRGLPAPGGEVHLHTHLLWREDGPQLFGFASPLELKTFRHLLNVSGVGPKGALAVLSAIGPGDLCRALAEEDVSVLTRVPGVGRKTAQRIILELKDKLSAGAVDLTPGEPPGREEEAVAALMALGYGRDEARRAVRRSSPGGETLSVGEQVRAALQWLGGQKQS